MRLRRRSILLILVAAAIAASFGPALRTLEGASLVIRAADLHGRVVDWVGHWNTGPVEATIVQIPTRHGVLRARLYRPAHAPGRTVLLTPGVHALGIDEPRLVKFANDLAAGGLGVVTPELPDLLEYRVTPRLPDQIEDAARWIADRRDLSPDGRASLLGISFSGGLSLVAAGRPSLKDRLAATFSFGGHGDLPRVMRFLCTGRLDDGTAQAPHDYGVVVILLNGAPRLVPEEQVEPLRRTIRIFLRASHLDMVDKAKAAIVFAEARRRETLLPEPARTLMHWVNTRNVRELGARLLPHVEDFSGDPSLSPERSPAPDGTVFLLHGADDRVIPASEARHLASWLAPHADVRLLVTPLITHAEVKPDPAVGDVWRLVRFWAQALNQ